MKSSKKLLVALLVLTMLLSTLSVGFADGFKDVENEDVSEAVERLVALKIINGYEDGTFRPANPITRAEFAKVVVTALGLGTAADYAKGASPFVDVAAAHWAVGYIKVASDMGIVQGRGNGIFAPEDQVTYAEAITMVVRALGYEPKAKYIGGFPGGYLAIASELELTDGVNVVNSIAANRGDVAIILDNALEAEIMEQTNWNPNNPEWKATEKTLLKDKLGVKVIEGIIDGFDEDDKVVTIDVDKVNGDASKAKAGAEYDVAEGISFASYKKIGVTAWELSKKIVYFEIEDDVIYDFAKDAAAKDAKVTLKNKDKEYVISAAVAKNDFLKVTLDRKNANVVENYGTLTKGGIITSVKDTTLEYTRVGDNTLKIRNIDDQDMLIIINGKVADYNDLAKGMYFEYAMPASDLDYVIVASDKVVEGELTRIKDGSVMIDGKYYDFGSPYVSLDDGETYDNTKAIKDLLGEDVEAHIGLMGEVVYVAGETDAKADAIYAVFVKKWQSDEDYMRVRLLDGTLKTYVVDKGFVTLGTDDNDAYVKFEINKDGEAEVKGYVKFADKIANVDKDKKAIKDDAAKEYFVSSGTKIYYVDADGKIKELDWNDIKGQGDINGMIVSVDELEAETVLVFVDYTSGDDTFYAIVLDKVVELIDDEFEVTLDKGDGKETILFTDKAVKTLSKGDAFNFEIDKKDNGVNVNIAALVKEAKEAVLTTGKSSIELGVVGTSEAYFVDKDTIVYLKKVDGTKTNYVEASLGEIAVGDEVNLYHANKGVAKVIIITVQN